MYFFGEYKDLAPERITSSELTGKKSTSFLSVMTGAITVASSFSFLIKELSFCFCNRFLMFPPKPNLRQDGMKEVFVFQNLFSLVCTQILPTLDD